MATARRTIPVEGKAINSEPSKSFGYWAMACTCATEASLFAYLITAYFYLDMRSPRWPPPGIEVPSLLIPLIMTAVLLSSSATMYWAEEGIKQGRRGQLSGGLAATIVLAGVFLALFAREYHEKLRHFQPRTHAYASIFYTTTSLHLAHVVGGMILVGFTLTRALRGHFTSERRVGVAVTSLYWHFVGIVWLAIFTCLYLSPHFA